MKNKNKFIILTFLGSFLLSSCDMSSYGEDVSDSVIKGLIPNFWAFLIQLLALIVLVLLVFKFGYKPLKKYLDKRSEEIDDEIKSAQKNNYDAKVYFAESKKNIADSKKEAIKIIEDAKNSADNERNVILENADKEASRILKDAKENAKKEIELARDDVKKEIINVALDASKEILSREINEKDNKKIVEDFINDLDSKEKK